MKKSGSILLLFFIGMIVCSLTSCIKDDVEPDTTYVNVGDRIPDFSVVMADGEVISSTSLRGAPALLVFFNTSCPDCRRELPVIQSLHDSYPALAIICIAREESAESISRYWRENGLTLPYSPQDDRSVFNLFASRSIPRIYTVSPDLTVTAIFDDTDLPDIDTLVSVLGL